MKEPTRTRDRLIVAGCVALCALAYFAAFYLPGNSGVMEAGMVLLIGAPIAVGAIILLVQTGGIWCLLQVIGSSAFLLLTALWFIKALISNHAWRLGVDVVWLSDEFDRVAAPMTFALLFLAPLFPLGFLFYALRLRRHLTNQSS